MRQIVQMSVYLSECHSGKVNVHGLVKMWSGWSSGLQGAGDAWGRKSFVWMDAQVQHFDLDAPMVFQCSFFFFKLEATSKILLMPGGCSGPKPCRASPTTQPLTSLAWSQVAVFLHHSELGNEKCLANLTLQRMAAIKALLGEIRGAAVVDLPLVSRLKSFNNKMPLRPNLDQLLELWSIMS